MVDHVQLQPALAAVVGGFLFADELVLPSRHRQQPCVGALEDAVEEHRLDVGLQHNLLLAAEVPVGCIGEAFHHDQLFFDGGALDELAGNVFEDAAVDVKTAVGLLRLVGKRASRRIEHPLPFFFRGEVDLHAVFERLFVLRHGGGQRGDPLFLRRDGVCN